MIRKMIARSSEKADFSQKRKSLSKMLSAESSDFA
jgi:hypothetical protein